MDGPSRRPTEQCRSEGTPSLGEVPSGGARAFCLLLRSSKVSRCKSGTVNSRYLNNGYTHKNQPFSTGLHSLAPSPTTTPESAGLCALAQGSNVCRSLSVQRSGLAARHNIKARRSALWRLCVGHFGAPGSLIPGLLTRAQSPPFSFSSDVWRLHQSRSVNHWFVGESGTGQRQYTVLTLPRIVLKY